MYYGVFTKDLKSIKCGEITLGEARGWLSKGYVICTEKEITTGLEIKIQFHKRPRWHWCKCGGACAVSCKMCFAKWSQMPYEEGGAK